MTKRLKFFETRNETKPASMHIAEYLFIFTVVDSSLIGTEAEGKEIYRHTIKARISDPQRSDWERILDLILDDDVLIKYLFPYCLRYVEEKIKTRSLNKNEKIDLSQETPQYDPLDPIGFEINVEEEKPKIGFHWQSS